MEKIITIVTDYGDQFATAQLHAVLAGLGYTGKHFDIKTGEVLKINYEN